MFKDFFPKIEYKIVPQEPVQTAEEIIAEVTAYFNNENKEVVVIKEDMLPIVMIEEKQYVVRTDRFVGLMGGGRKVNEQYPVPYYSGRKGNIAGFKFLYLYLNEETK